MQKIAAKIILFFLIQLFFVLSSLASNDAPHNDNNNISCGSCHNDTLLSSPFWGPVDDDTYNKFCLRNCHNNPYAPYNETSAPLTETHSSANTSESHGIWSIKCIECHDPHTQRQKLWKGTSATDLYLASGETSFSNVAPPHDKVTYDADNNTSTFYYSSLIFKTGWDAASITNKSLTQRRGIFFPNLKKVGFAYSIIDIDTPVGTIKVNGDATKVFKYTNPPTKFGVIYGQYIRKSIDIDGNGTLSQVKMFGNTGNYSFAYNENAPGIDPTPNGICQVCHTKTNHWRNDGTLAAMGTHSQFNGVNCTKCHRHSEGFKNSFRDHSTTDLGVILETPSCVICHTGPDPVVDIHNNTCSNCHQASMSLQPGLSPGDCANCHADINSDWFLHVLDHTLTGKSYILVNSVSTSNTVNCVGCHTGDLITGVHDRAATGGSAPCTKCHDATGQIHGSAVAGGGECTTCHTGHFDNHVHGVDGGAVQHDVDMRAGDLAGATACDVCHGVGGTSNASKFVADWNGTNDINDLHGGCPICHDSGRTTDTSSTGVQAIITSGTTVGCLNCHVSRGTSHMNHLTFDPDGAGPLLGVVLDAAKCTTCHNQGQAATDANFMAIHNNSCATCHVNPLGSGTLVDKTGDGGAIGELVNYELINNGHGGACTICHANYDTDFFAGHKNEDHRNVADTTDMIATSANCITTCHVGNAVDAVHDLLSSGGTAACLKCHTSANDGTLKVGSNGTAAGHSIDEASSCAICHASYNTDFTKHAVKDHSGVIANASPAGIRDNCVNCHTGDVITAVAVGSNPGTHQNSCTKCHTNTSTDGTLIDGANNFGDASSHLITVPSDCDDCHSSDGYFDSHSHTPHQISLDTTITPDGDRSQNSAALCSACHNDNGGSLATWNDILVEHLNACTTCHDASRDTSKSGTYTEGATIQTIIAANSATTCASCHRDKIDSIAVDASHGIDHKAEGKVTGAPQCTSCHDQAGNNSNTQYINTIHGTCNKCHVSFSGGGVLWDYSIGGGSIGDNVNYESINGGAGGTCAVCHVRYATNFADGHQNESHVELSGIAKCTSCHTTAIATAMHTSCDKCHTDMALDGTLRTGANSYGSATSHTIGVSSTCADCHGGYNDDFASHAVKDHSGVIANASPAGIRDNCVLCHTGDFITAIATGSNPGTHQNTCSNCHIDSTADGTLIDGINNYGDASSHLITVPSDCDDCHSSDGYFDSHSHTPHQISLDTTVAPNGDRSQNVEALCSACHNDNGGNLSTWTDILAEHLNACTTCHDASRDTSKSGTYTESATIQTIIAANSATTCASCHRDKIDSIAADAGHGIDHKVDGKVTGAPQCTSCHDQTSNDSNAQYINTIHGTCNKCHVSSSGGGALWDYSSGGSSIGDNVNYETINGGAGGTCVVCHVRYATNFADGHQNESHLELSGIAKCTSCHTTAIATTMHTSCDKCHTDMATDGTLRAGANSYGSATGHTIGGSSTCADCHSDYDVNFQNGHKNESHVELTGITNCTGCHSGSMTSAVHKSNCVNCHTNLTSNGTLKIGDHAYGTAATHTLGNSSSCADCHAAYNANFQNGHQNEDHTELTGISKCTSCHTGLIATAVHTTASCGDCHINNSTNGTLRVGTNGTTANHTIGGSSSCADCHAAYNTSFQDGHQNEDHLLITATTNATPSLNCAGCHNGDLIAGAWNHFNLCNDCHTDADTNGTLVSLAAGHTIGTASECIDCHVVANLPANHLGTDGGRHSQHLSITSDCSLCHTTRKPNPITEVGCTTCHQNGLGGLPNHTDYNTNWTNLAYNLSCDGCHNGRPYLDTLVMSNNAHERLVGEAGIRQYSCYYCHNESVDSDSNLLSKHANGTKNVAFAAKWFIDDQDPIATPTYDPATKICNNVYCHSDGTTVDPEIRPYPWDGGSQSCNSCHGHDPAVTACSDCHGDNLAWSAEQEWMSAMPMYENTGPGTDRANSHFRHMFTGFSCDDCHVNTVVGGCLDCHADANGNPIVPTGGMGDVAHVNGNYHVSDKKPTIAFKNGGTFDSGTKTCSNTDCHKLGTPPVWGGSVDGSVTCFNCHSTVGPDEDDFGGFNGTPARINKLEWNTNGHGRPLADGSYPGSDNPPADFPDNGCWYCHDNKVLHQTPDNPFRLRKHTHFNQRFEKECVYCHMSEDTDLLGQLDESQCMNCHNSTFTLAPQLSTIPAGIDLLANYNNTSRPDHTVSPIIDGGQRCDSANCHINDAKRHKTDSDQIWTPEQKADVQNQYVMMGVCLKCHDDDSGGQCNQCHQGAQYTTGFDPGIPGLPFKKPQLAKASSFHFGYKHYLAYDKSVQADPNAPVWKGGKFCWDCHDPHGDRNYNGDFNIYMIQGMVATQTEGTFGQPLTRSDVVFTQKVNGRDYARKDPPFDGICNVCHDDDINNPDRARNYNRSSGGTHNASRICTTCHEHRFTDSHADEQHCDTCHANKPIPRHTAFGLPRDCTKCHDGVINSRMNIMKQVTQSQSHHVQRDDGTVTNKDCFACHWEATKFGLIDLEHHAGFNYKTHSGVPDSQVDLVIWNKEDVAGSGIDDNTTKGSRPLVYDLDGSNPNGPGVPTATTFLAVDLHDNSADPAVVLAKERLQVENITPHCLGCHSDQNNDEEIFGDCKTPRQYAWDNNSIAARYSDNDTATWGKYAAYPNAAPKNLQKAFSAHGNAANNAGGFDPTNGVDGVIANTRANDQSDDSVAHNVQCYDCHSSHGSFVVGITSSYTSFDGEKHGGNLKETQAGYGGYDYSYKATAYPNPAAVNSYNAGAGQCFDCHETADRNTITTGSNRTPWGYRSTFGAAEPIIGYKDNPRFTGTYPGITESAPLADRPAGDSTVDLSYRLSRSTMGGHMNASHNLDPADPLRTAGYDDTSMNTNVYGSIDGLCSPCHDPHGVSPTLGANMDYGVPLLKGTYLTSPFKEDVTVPNPYGDQITTFADGTPQSYGKTRYPPTPYQPENARWNIDRTTFGGTDRITETDQQFAGLCLSCHPRFNTDASANLENGVQKDTDFRTLDRTHESVKGWGANTEHSYPCSKCHQPHASGLPRLLQTNCLNFNHRGGVLSGGQAWRADEESGSAHGRNQHRGYPIGNSLGNTSSYEATTACHSQAPNNPGTWQEMQLWNDVSPW